MEEFQGGRVFFSSRDRSLAGEDEIQLVSIGIDIGSSTTHLIVSRIVLERLDSRYVVSSRETLFRSEVLLTPFLPDRSIDAAALERFFAAQYARSGIQPAQIDTGALILTGVAVRRANARRIGELFADQAGKLVSVSAGDSLETIMAAHGSGAVARSIRDDAVVMNIDIGGGTAKIAICKAGAVIDATAVDVGARLVTVDADGRLTRIEEAARYFARSIGWTPVQGTRVPPEVLRSLASVLARALFDAIERRADPKLLRLEPLHYAGPVEAVVVSGGVSEFLYGRETRNYGDLGELLAQEVRQGIQQRGLRLEEPVETIRATVVGASQYTTQLSGSTIYVAPEDALPVRNVPVVPIPPLEDVEQLDVPALRDTVRAALARMELATGERPVALAFKWDGAATFARLDGFCRAVVAGLESVLSRGHPLIVVGDDDVGGLIGIHLKHELRVPNAVISVDGLELKSFDYIDIGALLPESGAVPVIIKSLVFPAGEALGQGPRTMLE